MAETTYNLAPNPVWQFTDFVAKYLKNGKMYTYRDTARTEPKPVYHDPEGMIPWENPLILSDPDGSAYPIYWASDENYYVELYDENDNLKYVFTDFNSPGFGNSEPSNIPFQRNYILDGQFRFPVLLSGITTPTTFLGAQFYYNKAPVASVETFSFSQFPLGQTEVPSNPTTYFSISCTVPVASSQQRVEFYLGDVNSFETNEVTFSFWARSSLGSTLTCAIDQYFGSGGSPSPRVQTNVFASTLTSSWTRYQGSIVVPTTSGKTRGTNNDDTFSIWVYFPSGVLFQCDMTNIQLELGAVATPYDYVDYNQDRSAVYGNKLPVPAYGIPSPDTGKYLTLGFETAGDTGFQNNPAFVLTALPLYTGFVITTALQPSQGPWSGWVYADGSLISGYENNMEAYNLYRYLYASNVGFNDLFYQSGDGFYASLVDGGMNALIANVSAGDAIDSSDFNTGMTVDTVVDGSLGVAQQTKIFGLPVASLSAGTYFIINGVANQFCCYLTIDGVGANPNLLGYTSIPIPLSAGMTASDVSAVIAFQLQGAFFAFDLTGYHPRFGPTSPAGTIRSPDSRTGGNVTLSSQLSAVIQHTHTYTAVVNETAGPGGGVSGFTTQDAAETGGVNIPPPLPGPSATETRGINIYLFPLIKL